MEGNCPTRFGEAMDAYEKSVARGNYETALTNIDDAISSCPYPSLYTHLSTCRASVVEAKKAAEYAKNRKWYQPRRLFAA